MDKAVIAQIVNTHGVKGEVKVLPLMDSPEMVLHYDRFYLENESGELHVLRARLHKQMLLIEFKEIDTMDKAESFKGKYLTIPKSELPALKKGSYYLHDLEGISVYTDEDEYLGKIDSILETGSRNVFSVLDEENKEILLPNIEDVVLNIDLESQRMVVHLMPGLRD
ncbi:16S rRNA processing protein RimM [Clostridia bacterium]|nr:16S rRNA processing protein RimM [Clostridia bacterium]